MSSHLSPDEVAELLYPGHGMRMFARGMLRRARETDISRFDGRNA